MILTHDQFIKFFDAIKQGLDTEHAASLAYINQWVAYDLLKRGKCEAERIAKPTRILKVKQSEEEALNFYLGFLKARAELQSTLLSAVRSSDNYKAQVWLLERLNESYAPGNTFNVDGVEDEF